MHTISIHRAKQIIKCSTHRADVAPRKPSAAWETCWSGSASRAAASMKAPRVVCMIYTAVPSARERERKKMPRHFAINKGRNSRSRGGSCEII